MGQDKESGRAANKFGRAMATKVANFLRARLISRISNEAVLADERIIIKSAHHKTPEIGLSIATLDRVDSIVAALEDEDGEYTLYRLDSQWYRSQMKPSRSKSPSAQKVMMVSCKAVREVGRVVGKISSTT